MLLERKSNDSIDQLYERYFDSLGAEPVTNSWDTLSKDLRTQNFLSFGWKHFNVYLIAGAGVLVSVVAYFAATWNTPAQSDVQVAPAAEEISIPNQSEPRTTEELVPFQGRQKDSRQQNGVVEELKNDSVSEAPFVKQDSVISEEPTIVQESKPAVVRKVYTQVIRDTTIVKDTVEVKRKKRKRE